jgi:hypothetical protein
VHPALRHFADELSATAARTFAYLGGLAVIAVTVLRIFGPPDEEAEPEPPRSDWVEVARPFRAFALTVPDFAQPEPDYAIRRHADGGRKDIMTWGDPSAARSLLMIEIYRPGGEVEQFGKPADDVAALTAALGGPYPLRPAPAIESKFGPVATFDFVANADERPRQCLGFQRAFDDPRLEVAGWYCRGGIEVIDRSVVACALERLSLLMAASEPKVTALFARAESQRKPCSHKVSPLQRLSNTLRHDWLATSAMPKLRGRVAAK